MLGGWLLLAGTSARPTSQNVSGLPRTITLTYLATVEGIPQNADHVHVWVPLASSRDGQHILHRRVRAPATFTITRESAYHNEMAHLVLSRPFEQPVEVEVDYDVELGIQVVPEPPPTPAELQREQAPSGLVIVDDDVRARAQEATAGRGSPTDLARGIYDYVLTHMTYDKTVPGWGRGDTRRACLIGKGNCTDFHSLFISLARAEHIPSRFKIGLVVPDGAEGAIPGYHCWAEFYVEGQGWVPVDASEASKHPERAEQLFGAHEPNRFLISVGRDLELSPPQHDKPVNIFIFPYAEIDGRPFGDVKTEFRFQERHPHTTDVGVGSRHRQNQEGPT